VLRDLGRLKTHIGFQALEVFQHIGKDIRLHQGPVYPHKTGFNFYRQQQVRDFGIL
jgi:hypothetical protein